MTAYSLIIKEDDIIDFWCADKEIRDTVEKYLKTCVDALQWRNRVERLAAPPTRIKEEEGE